MAPMMSSNLDVSERANAPTPDVDGMSTNMYDARQRELALLLPVCES
jgi:hypothetical protein